MGMNRLSSSSSNVSSAHRAWRLLRLALLWARNGGLLKCCRLRWLIPKHLKALKHHHDDQNHHHQRHHRLSRGANVAHYGERQLSFDETPVFHHMRRTNLQLLPSSLRIHIPCLKPEVVDFDFIDDEEGEGCWYGGRTTGFLENDDAGSYCYDEDVVVDSEEEDGGEGCNYLKKTEAQGIDAKADEFIAKFYRDIKLQRLNSYRQYTEMINRGSN